MSDYPAVPTVSDLSEVGYVVKTHGVRGEVNVSCRLSEVHVGQAFWLLLEQLPVPFFVKSARRRGTDAWLITFDDVDSEEAAKALAGSTLYVVGAPDDEDEEDDEDILYLEDLKGWNIVADGTPIGVVQAIDDTTDNVLYIVHTPEDEYLLIPANDDLIEAIDESERTLYLTLPEGLLNI